MTTNKKIKDLNFTQALRRLEEIVTLLEKPDLDLEEGLKILEEGVTLHKICRDKLTQANKKISIILREQHKQDKLPESEVI